MVTLLFGDSQPFFLVFHVKTIILTFFYHQNKAEPAFLDRQGSLYPVHSLTVGEPEERFRTGGQRDFRV
jgi:hypothetical protein